MPSIDTFITLLSKLPETAEATNLYRGNSRAAQVRRHNLRLYLERMQALQPQLLCLGEAPGHKGCGRTGIAFTSEKVLAEHPFFRGMPMQYIAAEGQPASEISAAVVWSVLGPGAALPLLWNSYPLHPHQVGKLHGNRTPRQAELALGRELLQALLHLFPVRHILAVGRKAEAQARLLGLPCTYLRHPAHGGQRDFLAGWQQDPGQLNLTAAAR